MSICHSSAKSEASSNDESELGDNLEAKKLGCEKSPLWYSTSKNLHRKSDKVNTNSLQMVTPSYCHFKDPNFPLHKVGKSVNNSFVSRSMVSLNNITNSEVASCINKAVSLPFTHRIMSDSVLQKGSSDTAEQEQNLKEQCFAHGSLIKDFKRFPNFQLSMDHNSCNPDSIPLKFRDETKIEGFLNYDLTNAAKCNRKHGESDFKNLSLNFSLMSQRDDLESEKYKLPSVHSRPKFKEGISKTNTVLFQPSSSNRILFSNETEQTREYTPVNVESEMIFDKSAKFFPKHISSTYKQCDRVDTDSVNVSLRKQRELDKQLQSTLQLKDESLEVNDLTFRELTSSRESILFLSRANAKSLNTCNFGGVAESSKSCNEIYRDLQLNPYPLKSENAITEENSNSISATLLEERKLHRIDVNVYDDKPSEYNKLLIEMSTCNSIPATVLSNEIRPWYLPFNKESTVLNKYPVRCILNNELVNNDAFETGTVDAHLNQKLVYAESKSVVESLKNYALSLDPNEIIIPANVASSEAKDEKDSSIPAVFSDKVINNQQFQSTTQLRDSDETPNFGVSVKRVTFSISLPPRTEILEEELTSRTRSSRLSRVRLGLLRSGSEVSRRGTLHDHASGLEMCCGKYVPCTAKGISGFIIRLFDFILKNVKCLLCIGGIPVISIIMLILGAVYWNECPAMPIPLYLVVSGAVGMEENFLDLTLKYHSFSRENVSSIRLQQHDEILCARLRKLTVISTIMQLFLCVWFLTGCIWVFMIYPPEMDDSSSPHYCNKTLYFFTYWMTNIIFLIIANLIIIFFIAVLTNIDIVD